MRVTFLLLISICGSFGQSHVAAGVSDVQAFVSNLPALKRVKPVYPTEAIGQGVLGIVELLVTIDSNGWVTATEPLTGPQVFRQAAEDAVRQWQFQPVTRYGRPVAAMTTTTVVLSIPGRKMKIERPRAGDPEDMAASNRIIELERRFPRSAEQVAADLEQATAGATPLDRFLRLPALAKAAFNAGDLIKATAYANESLDPPPSSLLSPIRRNGDGVHDGNMVLGLVAMKRGDVAAAKHYLLEAGKTTGSGSLDSFGPNMMLAKALAEAGERDVVLEYFDECRVFWKMGSKQLDDWSAIVRSGGVPDFKANLVY